MSTTQPGALARMVSDMTFAPDSPIPFPCKLQKTHVSFKFEQNDSNIYATPLWAISQPSNKMQCKETGARENLLDVCQLVVSIECRCNEYGSIHTQRVLLQTWNAHNSK